MAPDLTSGMACGPLKMRFNYPHAEPKHSDTGNVLQEGRRGRKKRVLATNRVKMGKIKDVLQRPKSRFICFRSNPETVGGCSLALTEGFGLPSDRLTRVIEELVTESEWLKAVAATLRRFDFTAPSQRSTIDYAASRNPPRRI